MAIGDSLLVVGDSEGDQGARPHRRPRPSAVADHCRDGRRRAGRGERHARADRRPHGAPRASSSEHRATDVVIVLQGERQPRDRREPRRRAPHHHRRPDHEPVHRRHRPGAARGGGRRRGRGAGNGKRAGRRAGRSRRLPAPTATSSRRCRSRPGWPRWSRTTPTRRPAQRRGHGRRCRRGHQRQVSGPSAAPASTASTSARATGSRSSRARSPTSRRPSRPSWRRSPAACSPPPALVTALLGDGADGDARGAVATWPRPTRWSSSTSATAASRTTRCSWGPNDGPLAGGHGDRLRLDRRPAGGSRRRHAPRWCRSA